MHHSKLSAVDKEKELLKTQLKRAYSVSKAIYEHYWYIGEIKDYITADELTGASELWNEDLSYDIQKLLYTAPTKGGAFTTKEREIIRGFWSIRVEDIE